MGRWKSSRPGDSFAFADGNTMHFFFSQLLLSRWTLAHIPPLLPALLLPHKSMGLVLPLQWMNEPEGPHRAPGGDESGCWLEIPASLRFTNRVCQHSTRCPSSHGNNCRPSLLTVLFCFFPFCCNGKADLHDSEGIHLSWGYSPLYCPQAFPTYRRQKNSNQPCDSLSFFWGGDTYHTSLDSGWVCLWIQASSRISQYPRFCCSSPGDLLIRLSQL